MSILFASPLALARGEGVSVSGKGYEGVVLSGRSKPIHGVKKYWTPSKSEIATLESKIKPYLGGALKKDPMTKRDGGKKVLSDLTKYKRQYVGIVKDGKRLIYVNMFCDSFDTDWRKDYLHVMDGGTCYIELEFDVRKGEFTRLYVHGEA